MTMHRRVLVVLESDLEGSLGERKSRLVQRAALRKTERA